MIFQARAIYPSLSLASHSCRANLRHAVNPGYQVALQVSREQRGAFSLLQRDTAQAPRVHHSGPYIDMLYIKFISLSPILYKGSDTIGYLIRLPSQRRLPKKKQ